jgi:DNA-binding GntR family transcriptional regulator
MALFLPKDFPIYRYCGSEVVLRLIDLLWARVGPYFYYAQLQEDVDLSASQRHHEAMYEAWVARDAAHMIAAIRRDLASPIRLAPPSTPGRREAPSDSGPACGCAAPRRHPSRRAGRRRS